MSFRLANWRPRLLLLLSLLGLCGLGSAGLAEDQRKPAMTIIIERGELLAGETVGLHVWIENPTSAQMTDVRFHYAGPAFLKFGRFKSDTEAKKDTEAEKDSKAKKKCAPKETGEISLDTIAPGSALADPLPLCLQAELAVEERDLNLGFSVTYKLVKGSEKTLGFLVTEKKLSVGLFGTESVGGVSLRLAAYVVPGLLFLIILRVFGFPWLQDLKGPEVATLSVLVSVLLFFGAARVPHFGLTFWGLGSAVSAVLFLVLCAAAIVISGLMILTHRLIKKLLWVGTRDDETIALRKALRRAKGDLRPVTVTTQENKTFVGSLMVPTTNEGVALLGWFELRPPQDHRVRPRLARLLAKGRLLRALQCAAWYGIKPEMHNPIRVLSTDGTLTKTGDLIKRFDPENIKQRPQGDVPGLEDERPLVLV